MSGKTQTEIDAALLQALYGDPKTRGDLQRIIRKHDPSVPLPELDLEERTLSAMQTKLDEERKEREKLQERLQTIELNRQLERARDSVVEKYSLTPEELVQVEKLITDEHFPTHEAAARLLAAERASAAEATPENYFEAPLAGADFKDFLADPDGAADKEAHALVDQYMAQDRLHRGAKRVH